MHRQFLLCCVLTGALLMILSFVSSAQQKPLFTQYVFNDFFYNPAIASVKNGADFKFLYRYQWAGLQGQPHTQTFSGCGSLKKFPLGIGGNIYHDKTGALRNIGFNVALSYGIRLKKESMIAAGISLGIVALDLDEDIHIREVNDAAVAEVQDGKVAPDIGLGIYYRWKGLYAGFSVPQINKNDPSDLRQIPHYFLAAGYRFTVAKKFELEPSFLIKAVKAAPVEGDITLRAWYNHMVWLGATYRTGDAAALFAGVLIKKMIEIGYAYDITTSNLRTVSSGSHEVVLGYKWVRKIASSTGYEVL
ncbi:MAG: membrane protein [Chitinophagales bacterium]|nr:MAG: membrane protein [Chitinophagales bacterium]